MNNQAAIKGSSAGMRLIAQTTIFNQGDFTRLRGYITDNYDETALAEIPLSARLAELKATYRVAGRLRVQQVIAIDKHRAVVMMESEKGGMFAAQILVGEEYPHKILGYGLQPIPQSDDERQHDDEHDSA